MNFLIADTFTASLARLTGEEQKAVKTTAFDLQMNPASPGLGFHRLDGPAPVLLLHPLPGLEVLDGDAGDDLVLLPDLSRGVAHALAEGPKGPVKAGHDRPRVDVGGRWWCSRFWRR